MSLPKIAFGKGFKNSLAGKPVKADKTNLYHVDISNGMPIVKKKKMSLPSSK